MSVIIIRNGRVLDPASGRDEITDIVIAGERIRSIGPADPVHGAEVIDARGLLVLPALVDLCARLREPGHKLHGSIASETRAAAAGGFGHLLLPPDTRPVIDSGAIATLIEEKARQAGFAQVYPIGALTRGLDGAALASMHSLKQAGCIGVGNARQPVASPETLLRCLQFAASIGLTVYFTPEEASLATGCVHDGFMAARLGLPGIPYTAETIALVTQLLLVEQTGVRAHFGQLSCAGAVELIRIAKERGLPVSADVSMHQLHLTDDAIDGFNGYAHVRPPFRSLRDRDALREGVRSGVIDAICSDHQPLHASAKQAPFPGTEPGISALETVLPLGLALVREGVLDLPTLIRRLSADPARVAGLSAGRLAVDGPADLCLFALDQDWTVSEEALLSAGKNTPFLGTTLAGKVQLTLRAGEIVYQE